MVIVSVGNSASELTESHIEAFLQFVNRNEQELDGMINSVLMSAPRGSRALETAQLLQRFLEDSRAHDEPILIDDVPIAVYLKEWNRR